VCSVGSLMMTVPLKYILTLALVSAATGAPTSIARPAASNVTVARMMPNTNFPAGDLPGKDHEFPPGTKPEACQALCDKTPECHAWTFLKRGGPGGQGMSCCIKGPIISDGCPHPAPGMVSGAKVAGSAQCTHGPPPKPPPPPPGPPYHHTGPLACQDNAKFPMLPTFHIIGNVSQATDGTIKLEPINDASGVTYYKGLYHVWHQCCQNHWDHVISKDLIHWQRLPPPIQGGSHVVWGASGERTYDGSISMLPMEDGGPIFLYDAPDKIPKGWAGCGECILSIARLNNTDDKYLQLFTRDEGGGDPVLIHNDFVNKTGAPVEKPVDFPSTIWKNGDHYNFIAQGSRFTTKDKSFRQWDRVEPPMIGCHENGGQWWIPTPNTIGGDKPPVGTPNWLVNCGGGTTYRIGNYHPENESFVWDGHTVANLEHGQAGWWGAQGGDANNDRMMMIGWIKDYHGDAGPGISFLTRLTLLREVNWDVRTQNLVSNPVPELLGLRSAAPIASETIPSLPAHGAPHVVAKTAGGAAASADIVIKFSAPSAGGSFGACVLGNGTAGSGIGITISLGAGQNASQARISSGPCNVVVAGEGAESGGSSGSSASESVVQLFDDESEITVRVLPDRSVADWFVQGGRWAASDGWQSADARQPADTSVMLWSSASGVSAQIDVWSMSCGWLNPSYTDSPSL
jgi:hypothetical protein